MITRRGFFGTVVALVVGGGAARLRLTAPAATYQGRPWTYYDQYFYGGLAGGGKTDHMERLVALFLERLDGDSKVTDAQNRRQSWLHSTSRS